MVNVIRRSVLVVTLLLTVFMGTSTAWAQLCPTSFGFPTIVHSASATGFVQDLASATNFQNTNIGFAPGCAFPSISQTSLQTQSVSHTEFSQTSEFDAVGYPFVSVGGGPLGGFSCC
jgi:hypothetical protein